MPSNHTMAKLGIVLTSLVLSACADYALTLNEKVVYMPPSLFGEYSIADGNLRGCVGQTISDQQITEASQLRQLNCSNAGITSLEGLGRFHALEELNLASNALQEVAELSQLNRLRILILRDNPLREAAPLLGLLNLEEVDLREIPDVACRDIQQLANHMTGKLLMPEQCDSNEG